MKTQTLQAPTPAELETLTAQYETNGWQKRGEKWHGKDKHFQVMVKFGAGPSEVKR